MEAETNYSKYLNTPKDIPKGLQSLQKGTENIGGFLVSRSFAVGV